MKKSFFLILTGLLLVGILVGNASAMTGTGTQSDPYKIYNQSDLALLSGNGYASYVGNTKYFELANDIVMSGNFTPIADSTYKFNGHFDGKNYSIRNLKISGTTNVAFFSYATSNASITNINFYSANITATDYYSAILCAQCQNAQTKMRIQNVNIYDSIVNVNAYFGGICGNISDSSLAEIKDCNVINCCIKSSSAYISAINGRVYSSSTAVTISSCNVDTCLITSTINTVNDGGVAGINALTGNSAGITISECNVTNSIITVIGSSKAGGIAGRISAYAKNIAITDCNVENCCVIAKGTASGICSYSQGYSNHTFKITNCHVKKCTIATVGMDDASGITSDMAYITISNCDVEDCCIKSYRSRGGGISSSFSTTSSIAIKNCSVSNCNIYASSSSSRYDIANGGYDDTSTATEITYVPNRYVYLLSGASLTNNSPQSAKKNVGETVTFTFTGRQQGAVIYTDGNKIISGYSFGDYGGGGTQVGNNPFTASYSAGGTKNVTMTLTGWNGSASVSGGAVTTTAYIQAPVMIDNLTTTPSSGSYSPTNVSITLRATTSGQTPTSYVWYYTTASSPSASSSWVTIKTTSTNSTTYTPTSTGKYTFRVVISTSGYSADSLDTSYKPYLQIFTPLTGAGTSSNPYQVGSASNLSHWNTYYSYYSSKYMVITNDFTPTVTITSFSGNLNGNNHTLTNCTKPLFSTLGGTVSNLKFTDSIVSGTGILATTCSSSGSVSNVTVDDCFISGSNAGGLVGTVNGSLTNCTLNHVTIKATGSSGKAGGLFYTGNGIVTNCHVLNCDILGATTYGVCA